MKKCLIVSTVSRQFTLFERGNIQVLKKLGYEIHCAANFDDATDELKKLGIICHPFDIQRSPYSLKNIKAYRQLKKIINEEDYDLIHCHSPMGGVLTRLAARKKRKNGTKVFYTAHGFHFFKGAPLLNWLFFYPVEKYLSKYTDTLITINQEDYNLAKNKFYASNIEFVNGIGVDENKFDINISESEKEKLREKLGIAKDDFVIISIGELNDNKNQIMQIRVMKELIKEHKNIKLLLAGEGKRRKFLEQKIQEYNLLDNIKLLGYRTDIPQLLKISNLALSTSKREGLPVNVIEALMSGLSVIGTNCRGTRDLVKNGVNGYIVENDDYYDMVNKIENFITNKIDVNFENKNYTKDTISNKMREIYLM